MTVELGSWILLTGSEPESGIQGPPHLPWAAATGLLLLGLLGLKGSGWLASAGVQGFGSGSRLSPAPALLVTLENGGGHISTV